jgi:hypothetical protein
MTLASWTRRSRLTACTTIVASLAAAVWLAVPGSAAPPASCHGHVGVTAQAHQVDDNAIEYVFGCSAQVSGFTVFSTSKELSAYSPNASVLNTLGLDATQNGNKEFECGGDLPGYSHNCGKGILKPGYVARGELSSTDVPCGGEPTQWWLVTVDDVGQMHGPFNMGKRTRGCPRASAKKAKRARATRR